jgi:hypothetical protein
LTFDLARVSLGAPLNVNSSNLMLDEPALTIRTLSIAGQAAGNAAIFRRACA